MVAQRPDINTIYAALEQVTDPEVPVLNVMDLGIVRDVVVDHDGRVEIVITPTYSGCPAMEVIAMNLIAAATSIGYRDVRIKQVLSPAWTTDWMTEEGKRKLKEYGIAPPGPKPQVCNEKLFAPNEAIECPHCDSWHTHRVSEFGSTACKALYVCDDCKEPFEHFKCH